MAAFVYNDQTKPLMKFGLFTPEGKELEHDLNDLYFIKVKHEKGGLFILFNKDNKMLSFAAWIVGFNTSLMQF